MGAERFADGELVVDTELNETFLYNEREDAVRAETGKLRKATNEERTEYERFMQADTTDR